MKKFVFFFAAMLLMPALFAQPVLNNSMNYSIGNTFRLDGYLEVFNISPGEPGANKTWNFATIVGEDFFEGSPQICVHPSTTPFADSAAVLLSDIAIKNVPTEPGEPFIYQYVKSKSNAREYYAMGMILDNTYGTYAAYKDAWIDLIFPMGYNQSFNFNVESLLFDIYDGFYYMRDSTHVTVVADAWGSITTPAGNYPSVLRLKTTEVSHSWYRFEPGEPWWYMGEWTFVSYHWFAPNIKAPVMVMHEYEWKKDSGLEGFYYRFHPRFKNRPYKGINPDGQASKEKDFEYSVSYLADYNFTLSTNEIQDHSFSIFPNPAQNMIRLSTMEDLRYAEATIYNQFGQTVFTGQLSDNTIDISTLSAGLHIIELQANGKIMRNKLVVRK